MEVQWIYHIVMSCYIMAIQALFCIIIILRYTFPACLFKSLLNYHSHLNLLLVLFNEIVQNWGLSNFQ